jgi:NTP pyrophosphatase (non-canonical NTP hydrolase)
METQQSISQWAAETFGQPCSNLRVATRAGEEMFELFKEISTGGSALKSIEEAADVAIVLYRLAERLGVTIDTSLIKRQDPNNPDYLAAEANAKMASVIVLLCIDDHNRSAGYSLQQIYYFLEKFCQALGGDLHVAIAEKMKINRQRTWRDDGSGCSYHVKE